MKVSEKPALQGTSIVLIGSFNPAILRPDWLSSRNLIRADEGASDTDETLLVTREYTRFRLKWLDLEVTQERFKASTTNPAEFPTMQELVLGIFQFLEHTPMTQMGINRDMHFPIANEEDWHALGDLLAPKEPWKEFLKGTRKQGLPGLRSLQMEGIREGSAAKRLVVKVEPSIRTTPGLYVSTNEHYEETGDEAAQMLMHHLKSDWNAAQEYAESIAQGLLKRGAAK